MFIKDGPEMLIGHALESSWSLPSSKDIFEARGGSREQRYHGNVTMADQSTAQDGAS